jgi:hypothetical protein
MTKPDPSPPELLDWLRGVRVAAHLRAQARAVTKAVWLEAAYGSSNETVLVFRQRNARVGAAVLSR